MTAHMNLLAPSRWAATFLLAVAGLCAANVAAQPLVEEGRANVRLDAPDGGAPVATATVVDHDGAQRLSRKALARIKEGAWDEAAELFRQAHDKDPENAAIATDFGFTLAHLGKRDQAERLYRQAVQLDPKRFYAYVNLAELWAGDPTRWQRLDEMLRFLDGGVLEVAADARAQANVQLRIAELLRSVGQAGQARKHIQPLTGTTVPAPLRRRALQLIEKLEAESRQRALEDWPLANPSASDRARLSHAAGESDVREALRELDDLIGRNPAWAEARWRRSRRLESMGQFDEAASDLTVVVQLMPSHALAWRQLGIILARHGGRLEAERADEALRQALAIEPSWSDLRELRAQVAAKRSRLAPKSRGQAAPEPTAKALALFQEAQSWIGMEAPEMAVPLVRQALGESPAFVDAAAALYNLDHAVPEATVKALWDDGPRLWQLAIAVAAIRGGDGAALARPWIDRAVELGVAEARFTRASLRAAAGDKAGALTDLRDYVAAEPSPKHLEEARALRMTLVDSSAGDSPERLAQLRLASDRPSEALAALGGSCTTGLPFESLMALGKVREFSGDARTALDCYGRALGAAVGSVENTRRAWERSAAASTNLAASELGRYEDVLRAAANADVPLAHLVLARLAESRRAWSEALAEVQSFMARADADEPRLDEARALQARIGSVAKQEIDQSNERRRRARSLAAWLLGMLAAGAIAVLFVRRLSRKSLLRALREQPLLFPALAKAIGQVRHDVLKHRASAIELLADPHTERTDVLRTMLEPTPASAEVVSIYQHLSKSAAGLGVRLCPLAREPVFGRLTHDLASAEGLLRRSDADARAGLKVIDMRLRHEHPDRLQRLLRAGPRTLVHAGLVARWIEATVREPAAADAIAPSLYLQEAEIAFPLPAANLFSIVSNLLRNAVAVSTESSAGDSAGAVEVRIEQGRDSLGKKTVGLVVADCSPRALTMSEIEARPADRGLGIVRETARTWGGQIAVEVRPAPFRKALAVRFPAPPAAEGAQ